MSRLSPRTDGPFRAFDATWFHRWQWLLLAILHEPLLGRVFRWILGIDRAAVGHRARIVALWPHGYVTAREEPGRRHLVEYAGFRPRWVRTAPQTVYTADIRTDRVFAKAIYAAFWPVWWTLHAWDWAIADRWVPAWSAGLSTLTAYPDAHPESMTVDGNLQVNVFGDTWANVIAANANTVNDTGTDRKSTRLNSSH